VRPRIPASVDGLTAGWFSGALGAQITAVNLERLGGLSSLVHRARLAYRGEPGPASVIVKLPMVPAPRGEAFRAPGFDREVRFYRELAPRMHVSVPRAFVAESDPSTGDYVLVIEDFPGHVSRSDEAVASPAELRALVTEVALLHAAWWDSPELAGYDFLRTFPDFIERVESQFARCMPTFLERFGGRLDAGQQTLVDALPGRFRDVVEPLTAVPVTLAHHDLSLRNVLFGVPPVVLIDWQLTQRVPGVRDLSYLVGANVPAERRSGEEPEMLRRYQSVLEAAGVQGYSPEALFEDYRRSVVCDFGRMVMTAGWQGLSPGIEAAVAHQLACRLGSVEELRLLHLI
jgi:hypothetical protein